MNEIRQRETKIRPLVTVVWAAILNFCSEFSLPHKSEIRQRETEARPLTTVARAAILNFYFTHVHILHLFTFIDIEEDRRLIYVLCVCVRA